MSGSGRRRLAAALACGIALCVVADLALHDQGIRRSDAEAVVRLDSHHHGFVGGAADAFAFLGTPIPQLALAALLLTMVIRRRLWWAGAVAVAVLASANFLTFGLKHLLAQSRWEPVIGFYGIGSTSFPSGHTTAMAAMTFAYWFVVPRRRRSAVVIVGATLTALVGTSMVVRGQHFPSDIVGGALVAATCGFASATILAELGRSSPPLAANREAA